MRGVLNDAISIYFADAPLAIAFVARWCAGSKVETAGGAFQVREDEPAARGCTGRRVGAVELQCRRPHTFTARVTKSASGV
jgi:hypothetical protein